MAFSDSWTDDERSDGDSGDGHSITVTSQISASKLGEFPALTGRFAADKDPRVPHDHKYPHPPDEVRVVDKDTGGEKGSKLARFDLLPADPLRQLAEHYGKGALKYDARNWERGYAWSLTYAALQRHANAFWSGEDIDPDSGSHHMVAVAWHALALVEFARTHKEKDDRP